MVAHAVLSLYGINLSVHNCICWVSPRVLSWGTLQQQQSLENENVVDDVVQVQLLAGVLSKHGVQKGDRVLIYMPMIPEAVVAMMACARLGAIHSLVFGGFASKELATRINHAQVTGTPTWIGCTGVTLTGRATWISHVWVTLTGRPTWISHTWLTLTGRATWMNHDQVTGRAAWINHTGLVNRQGHLVSGKATRINHTWVTGRATWINHAWVTGKAIWINHTYNGQNHLDQSQYHLDQSLF